VCAKDIKLEQTREIAKIGMRRIREKRKSVKKLENPHNH